MRYTDKWLTERGYDGLYDAAAQGEDSCGCHVGDIYPCDRDHRDGRKCKPGVMINNDDGSTGIGEKVKPKRTVIMFQEHFIPLIESGAKQNTIRGRYIAPGTVLSLRRWTEKPYRSKQEVIKEVTCTGCYFIILYMKDASFETYLDGSCMKREKLDTTIIAKLEGFDSYSDLQGYFRTDFAYCGYLIRWDSKTDQEFIESVRLK